MGEIIEVKIRENNENTMVALFQLLILRKKKKKHRETATQKFVKIRRFCLIVRLGSTFYTKMSHEFTNS